MTPRTLTADRDIKRQAHKTRIPSPCLRSACSLPLLGGVSAWAKKYADAPANTSSEKMLTASGKLSINSKVFKNAVTPVRKAAMTGMNQSFFIILVSLKTKAAVNTSVTVAT